MPYDHLNLSAILHERNPNESNPKPKIISNVVKGADAHLITRLARQNRIVYVYLASNEMEAKLFQAHCQFFAPEIESMLLPSRDCLPYSLTSPSSFISAQRISVLSRLRILKQNGIDQAKILIITVSSMIERCPPASFLADMDFQIEQKKPLNLDRLSEYFSIYGYRQTSLASDPGEYALRGSIIDVFSPLYKHPFRIDLFGDQVESIHYFDVETQRSLKACDKILIQPVSELIFNQETLRNFKQNYVRQFGSVPEDKQYEMVLSMIRFPGIEFWLALFYNHAESLFDYLPKQSLLFLPSNLSSLLENRYQIIQDCYQSKTSKPTRFMEQGNHKILPAEQIYLLEEEWKKEQKKRKSYQLSPFQSDQADLNYKTTYGYLFTNERQAQNIHLFHALIERIRSYQKNGKKIILACWSKGSSDRLQHILKEYGFKSIKSIERFDQINAARFEKTVFFALFPLERGVEFEDIIVISEQDILGERLSRSRPVRKRKTEQVIQSVSALNMDDLIVHYDHGVGRYKGLKTLKTQGFIHDYLELEYAGNDRLFLPVEHLDILSKYGSDDPEMGLDKLGNAQWQIKKARIKQNLLEHADHLIKIAAQRKLKTVDKLYASEKEYDEFCTKFPYIETEDQSEAISEVLKDLAKGYPMDRLICGDVGFGKTEIALRAAFIMAMAGYQTAFIAPTTLLSRQHFNTFLDRFSETGIEICQLSRFVSPKQANMVKEKIKKGQCDIVIGTHSIFSKTIQFKTLGLVIIDEEQRFGVKHKEYLKQLKTNAHVLTLTATPIPRTLQMSLSGLRDLSIITTPPIHRLSVQTYITEFDKASIRQALLKEKNRGGQSFFIVPRISDIDEIKSFLTLSVPEVNFCIAHGQMTGSQLETIMTEFCSLKYDVLLSTSIIESGIDIPTANTILIYKSERFGLAQLYQMRGRVGRSKLKAYAYLLISANQELTLSAQKRLEAIQSLTALGSGYLIASHDLDQRGGGNLLGDTQSGQIREVGVELYHTMLEEALQTLKNKEEEQKNQPGSELPHIHLQANILIPESYIRDIDLRLSFYRRLARLETDEEGEALSAELIDRFGSLPSEVMNLIEIVRLKVMSKALYIKKISTGKQGAVFEFSGHHPFDPNRLLAIIQQDPAMKLRADSSIYIRRNWEKPDQQIKDLKEILKTLSEKIGTHFVNPV